MADRGAQLMVVVLFAGIAALIVVGLQVAFGNGDEVIYAQSLREMRASGDWGTLTWQGHASLQRPTLPFLPALAISSVVAGELGLRLFGGLCLLVTLALVYRIARMIELGRGLAAAAVLFAVGFPGLFFFGRSLLSDPPFLLATTAALWAAVAVCRGHQRAMVGVGAALGLAVAFKSLAAAIPIVLLGPWMLRSLRLEFRPRLLIGSLLAFLVLALPYYLYSVAQHGRVFFEQHFGWNLVERAAGGIDVGLSGGVFAYLRYLWLDDGPLATVILLGGSGCALVAAARERRADWALLGSFAPLGLLIYSLIGTRLPHYLLPIYPAGALSATISLAWILERRGASPLLRALPGIVAFVAFTVSVTRPPDAHLLTSGHAHRLGLTARGVDGIAKDTPLYSYEWYAPAVAYYADRRWVQLTTSKQLFDLMESIPFLRDSNVTVLVPPWPAIDEPTLVVAPRALEHEVPGKRRELAGAGDFVLLLVEP